MKRIVLVTGGARSGKSNYAEEISEKLCKDPFRRYYIATAQAFDEEMKIRIQKHKESRGQKFVTVEEPLDLASAITDNASNADLIMVDCLTVWVSNLMYHFENNTEKIQAYINSLVSAISSVDCNLVFVTNETGSGIVPNNSLSRLFRDYAGILNQKIACKATDVFMTVCGIPMVVKGNLI